MVTAEQMIAVDRVMVGDYGVLLVQMMERARRHLAHLARARFLPPQARGHNAIVFAGPGGNGGGALVCARCLAAWGTNVSVFVTGNKDRLADIPRQQFKIVQQMGIEVRDVGHPPSTPTDLIIDGIVGYSLRGALRGRTAELAERSNCSSAPILPLDIYLWPVCLDRCRDGVRRSANRNDDLGLAQNEATKREGAGARGRTFSHGYRRSSVTLR
ncbi:MAG: NAD(P)H-hydrate epimerase [Alphaproteobacteria bacterium]|nr:NAD(P)H-hydrate epimerase [Alphaproteobacteria bacterium]MDE2493561.1 NAD(P)H-hydrate epimerase [Alphaproteobacteria bacterium]